MPSMPGRWSKWRSPPRSASISDCPPRHGDIQRSALMVADMAILPCGPSSADAWALAASIDLINEARTLRPELEVRIVITRKQVRTALGRSAPVKGINPVGGLGAEGQDLLLPAPVQRSARALGGDSRAARRDLA